MYALKTIKCEIERRMFTCFVEFQRVAQKIRKELERIVWYLRLQLDQYFGLYQEQKHLALVPTP